MSNTETLNTIVKDYTMPYGKFKGVKVGSILETDKGYLDWLSENSRDSIFKHVLTNWLSTQGTTDAPNT